MRSKEMTVGKTYIVGGQTVTYLPTPDEVRAKHNVRVRFETGVPKGNVADLHVRRIQRPADPEPEPEPRTPAPVGTTVVKLQRAPQVGDTVTIAAVSDLQWTVQSIDGDQATIATRVYEQNTTQQVPLKVLQVCVEHRPQPRPVQAPRPASAPPAAATRQVHEPPRTAPAPNHREARIAALLDRVLFTPRCVDQYARRFDVARRRAADALRAEARLDGHLVRIRRSGEYARIRVPGRFDIVLPRRPDTEELLDINSLHLPKTRGVKGRPHTPGKHKGRAA